MAKSEELTFRGIFTLPSFADFFTYISHIFGETADYGNKLRQNCVNYFSVLC